MFNGGSCGDAIFHPIYTRICMAFLRPTMVHRNLTPGGYIPVFQRRNCNWKDAPRVIIMYYLNIKSWLQLHMVLFYRRWDGNAVFAMRSTRNLVYSDVLILSARTAWLTSWPARVRCLNPSSVLSAMSSQRWVTNNYISCMNFIACDTQCMNLITCDTQCMNLITWKAQCMNLITCKTQYMNLITCKTQCMNLITFDTHSMSLRGYIKELWFPPDGFCYWAWTNFIHVIHVWFH